jgi:hypothetical protein
VRAIFLAPTRCSRPWKNSQFPAFLEVLRWVFGEGAPLRIQVSLDYGRRKKDNFVSKRAGAISVAEIGVMERPDDRKQFFAEDLRTE